MFPQVSHSVYLGRKPSCLRENPLQRLFSTFPGGWPGAALLLLRVTIGTEAAVQGAFYLSHGATWTLGVLLSCLPLAMGGACLLVGFLTPIASILVGIATVGNAMSWLPPPPGNLFDSKLVAFEMIVMAAAMASLGPGAFSVDARLFGRREIVIPPSPRRPGS